MIEAYLNSSGLSSTNLHPTSFMQNLLMLRSIGGAPPGVLPRYIGDARTSWVDSDDVADAAAVILRDPEPHAGRSYLLGAEVASIREITEALSTVTGRPWREERREPEEFFRTVTAAGADPMYMACVRTIFERTRQGTLPDMAETSDALNQLRKRPTPSIQSFAERHRDQFMTDVRTVPGEAGRARPNAEPARSNRRSVYRPPGSLAGAAYLFQHPHKEEKTCSATIPFK